MPAHLELPRRVPGDSRVASAVVTKKTPALTGVTGAFSCWPRSIFHDERGPTGIRIPVTHDETAAPTGGPSRMISPIFPARSRNYLPNYTAEIPPLWFDRAAQRNRRPPIEGSGASSDITPMADSRMNPRQDATRSCARPLEGHQRSRSRPRREPTISAFVSAECIERVIGTVKTGGRLRAHFSQPEFISFSRDQDLKPRAPARRPRRGAPIAHKYSSQTSTDAGRPREKRRAVCQDGHHQEARLQI